MVRKATPDWEGTQKSPDGVDPSIKRTRKTQCDGHNSGVKIWSLCSISSTLSHANLEQPFRTLAIKWEVNIFLKKSSCILLASLSLCRCELFYIYMRTYVDVNLHIWLYNTKTLVEVGEVWLFCSDAVGVFNSPSQLGCGVSVVNSKGNILKKINVSFMVHLFW